MPNYRRSQFDFVIDNSFRPYSFQEMVAPLALYKDAYEKTEEAYDELTDKADTFKYLSNLSEDSNARKIYEGYANELNKQAQDLASHGLTMQNRRALSSLRKRYQGEIGMLANAKESLDKERELRRTMSAKDSSMLWGREDLDIDDYLYGKTPNTYGISGTELYTRGAAAGKNASSRIYSVGDEGSTLGGYYRNWTERMGYSKESIDAFRANASAIPELQQAADNILTERGVIENLKDNPQALQRARQSVLNGIIDGAVYQESTKPVRDEGVMGAEQKARIDLARAANTREQEKWDREKQEDDIRKSLMYRQKEDGTWEFNPNYVGSNYTINPATGKLVKNNSTQTTEERKEISDENKKGVALLKLDKKDLANNGGFDVTFGDNRHHYDYIGAISRHGNKWHTGGLGEDNPGHNFPGAWGWASTSNVENSWGNFSAEGSDSKQMRVLSSDEFMRLVSKDEGILNAIQERCQAVGVDPNTADIQIVEVPNEKGGGGQKGYLIAVH